MIAKLAKSVAQRSLAGKKNRPAVTRALQLLEALAAKNAPVALTDLAQTLDLPTATAFRLCQKLEEDGYLTRDGSSPKYIIGARLMRLGLDIVRGGSALNSRRAILNELVDAIGETCNLTALVGTEVLYLDRVETRWPLRLSLEPGSRVPLHCTASGKLLLASLPKATRLQLLKTLPLTANTPNTIIDRVELDKDLQRISRRGFSTDNEEFLVGLVAVAVPVQNKRGKTFAAVACHAPIARLSLQEATALVPILEAASAKLAQTFEGSA